jgi:thymidylate synthase
MYLRVNDIRQWFRKLHSAGKVNSRGMLEIQGVSFIADKDRIFGTPNKEYIEMEIEWYLSQSLNVYDMRNPPKVWMDVATTYGNINSNYGYLVFSKENGEQFRNVIRTLRKRPDSKQATMVYTRPSIHKDAYIDGMKDFICTNAVNYNQDLYDSSKINCIVQMRSNDAIFGYKNDWAWHKFMLDKVCSELGKQPGDIIWQCASLHIYPRHLDLVAPLFESFIE